MTQGVFPRFPTKKAMKEVIASDPSSVSLEATSIFGNEYGGLVSEAPDGTYTVVGPDPHTNRKWYANIVVSGERITVR